MTREINALDNLFHFLVGFPRPQEVISFRASEEESNRFDLLIEQNRKNELSNQEIKELDKFILAERYMRLAKANALLATQEKKIRE